MYSISRIDPTDWEQIPYLAELYKELPAKLRFSPTKCETKFRKKTPKLVTNNPYIGYNTPFVTKFIVIDLDYNNSLIAYYDAEIPRPQFVIKNPKNGHCQYLYRLKDPVSFFAKSRQAPIDLLNAVEWALNDVLKGDKAFSGYLAKNLFNTAHELYYTGAEPYALGELAKFLNLPSYIPPSAINDESYGRNVSIFNAVRQQAYAIAYSSNYTQLYSQCLEWATKHNERYNPRLPYNEIKSISKSIARYCTSTRFRRSYSELQAHRGAKGGKVSKRKPVATSERTVEPWLKMGISRATYYRRKKQGKI